ncbi:MAG: NUDIX domain-containing protein [Patescibacteria group bacterium]|nr:NUDIX domain-containing protein [Patescibacteria group bacterium]
MNREEYFSQKIDLIQVDRKDKELGPVDRWKAHLKGVLHRGFTCIIKNNGLFVIQKRKHKVFNNVFDLSFSSHPRYLKKDHVQSVEEAIKENFKREWRLKGKITSLRFLEKYYYKEKDPHSDYTEHEINYLYLMEIEGKIENVEEFSYGMDYISLENILKKFKNFNFAPWVKKLSLTKIKRYLS